VGWYPRPHQLLSRTVHAGCLSAGDRGPAAARRRPAALEYFRVPDAGCGAERYAPVKQEHITKLIKLGQLTAFPDVLRFVLNVTTVGIPVAATSSSKNADLLLQQVRLDTFAAEHHPDSPLIWPSLTLLGLLATDVSGRDLPRGRPHPLIFVTAASQIGAVPGRCFVAGDAVPGVQAAKAGAMAALGVPRLGDEKALRSAGADLVVRTGVPQR